MQRPPVQHGCAIVATVNTAAPPTVTLMTDFGDGGPFVGVMKAAIWALAPSARIVDLGHHVPQHWPAEAGFWLGRTYQRFPPGTVNVVVVDPGVGSARAILAARFCDRYFLAPDNGILPMIPGFDAAAAVHRVGHAWLHERGLPEPSATFHGRDFFAPAAACLGTGTVRLEELGDRLDAIAPAAVAAPAVSTAGTTGCVVAVDTWGNLITNIDAKLLGDLRAPRVFIGDREIRLARTYADMPAGELLALINSFGTLEIARAQGSAEQLLGLGRGDPVRVADDD